MENVKVLGHFIGVVNKVQTTRDGGFRLTLDIPETNKEAAKLLMDLQNKANVFVFGEPVVVKEEEPEDGQQTN
jgi:hypothetical protein